MDWTEILTAVTATALGSGLIVGMAFYFARRGLEKKLSEKEAQTRRARELRARRVRVEDELCHAYGRMFFWLYESAVTGCAGGGLKDAWELLSAAEARKKELDREILSERVSE